MKRSRIAASLAVLSFVLILPLQAAFAQIIPLRPGINTIPAARKNMDVVATIVTEAARTPVRLSSIYGGNVPMVSELNITVNGFNVLVPYSVFAPIYDPRQADLDLSGKTPVLRIYGGQGAEAYEMRIYFNKNNVTKKEVFTQDLKKPLEESHYHVR